jgi:tetratricopeptide (TPR) repeat protein
MVVMQPVRADVTAGHGRYALVALLGQGGMGAVYRAFDREAGQWVALKRLVIAPKETRRLLFTELFHHEYRVSVRLVHPHLVRAYDYGVDEDGPYYTMELIEGEALRDLPALPWREVCALMRDTCSAVALLHSRRLLHRDVSPRNIQRTRDGRAKLLDFGAIVSMGPCSTLVGTPPFVPPEALLLQSQDGRADLYALGGTLYYALTGRNAYPAQTLDQLPALWRLPVAPPSLFAPDLAPELDALVLSLLSQDPLARPRSAAEVIDRLTAIAQLSEDDQPSVSRAYVSTPELVGRSAQLQSVRERLEQLRAGQGGALAIEGAAGSGRSRMLDTTVLEAKLAGLRVARTSAVGSAAAPYGALCTLVRALCDLLTAAQLAKLQQVPALALLWGGEISAELDRERRAELQNALLTLLTAAAASSPLVLAVDDLDHCDEPSQAALASSLPLCERAGVLIAATLSSAGERSAATLSSAGERSAATLSSAGERSAATLSSAGERSAATLSSAAERSAACSVFSEGASSVAMSMFDVVETDALLCSVFGDVPHLGALAVRIHELAEGSPRGCMELVQHLLADGAVQYSMGSWVLPSRPEGALSASPTASRRAQLAALSPDARELAAALAVADGSGLAFAAHVQLTSHADAERARVALDELLAAQLLRGDGARYTFQARVWVEELLAALEPAQLSVLCRRVAAALAQRNSDRLEVARYQWRAGDRVGTLHSVLAELRVGSRRDRAPADYAQLLQGAADVALELKQSARDRFLLLHEIVRLGQDLTLPDIRTRMAQLFDQLRQDSGLLEWEQLDPSLDASTRMQRAVALAQQRYDAAPESERGLAPLEAIIALARLVADLIAVAAQTGDYALFGLLPPLQPFVLLSPMIERLQRLGIPGSMAVVAGRYEDALVLYQEILERTRDPGQLDETLRLWAFRAVSYALGCIEAGLGRAQSLQHAGELEQSPAWVVPAWSVRRIYYLVIGNLREAERCRKQIELLLLRSPVRPPLYAGAVHQHVYAYAMVESLSGMRQAAIEIEALARSHPTLGPFVPFTRGLHARACGDYAAALALFDETLARVEPGKHPLWPWAVAGRTAALVGLERYAEACAFGRQSVATGQALGLGVMRHHMDVALALAEAKFGDFASACERLELVSAARESLDMGGVSAGWVFEARARVALWMGDRAAFTHFAERCAERYRQAGGDPALAARYERLLQEARALQMLPGPSLDVADNALDRSELVTRAVTLSTAPRR